MKKIKINKGKIGSGAIGVLGFILSPLSWWNDIVINFPLSYLMATPFGLLKKELFLPAFIVSYWVTNILGLVLMQYGIGGVVKKKKMDRKELIKTMMFCVLYSILIGILVQIGVIKFPSELLERIR